MLILIKNGWVIVGDIHQTELKRGQIVVKNGLIEEVSTRDFGDAEGFDRVLDASGKIVIPGLINGHIHSYANLVKATIENLPLEPWMLYITAEGRCMDVEDIYYNTLLGCIEMIKNGTTSCVDHLAQGFSGLDAAMRAYRDAGFRAAVAPMISDKPYYQSLPVDDESVPEEMKRGPFSLRQDLLDTTIELYKKWHGKDNRLKVMFGPSGPQRCTDELLTACARLAQEYDTGFHSHVLETKYQAQAAEHLYHKPMIMHLDELGCLNERISLVHGVWLTKEEAQLAAERGAVVVHNPASNLTLGSGIAPINTYRELKLTVALGTDGANCGGNLNMLESMKLAAMLHKSQAPHFGKWVTAGEVFQMATLNSACISLQNREIGSLEAGKRADVVILNPAKSPCLVPLQSPVRQLVYSETGTAVETVMIEGKIVLDDGAITIFDEKKVYTEAERRAAAIVEKSLKMRAGIDREADFIKRMLFPVHQDSR
ncbi:MAG: amidohydrolase [Dehalobacterium sp.]